MTDDEIVAMLKARYAYIEPNERINAADDTPSSVMERGWSRSEWHVEAFARIQQLRDGGMSAEEAGKRVFPDYRKHNASFDSFLSLFWRYKRETAIEEFSAAIIEGDFRAAVAPYKLLSPHAKQKRRLL